MLNSLQGGERYGYDLVKALVARPGLGITEGTIYPLLSRLRSQGFVKAQLVESREGPARKYYKLTRTGNKERGRMNTYYHGLSDAVDTLLTPVS